MAKIRAWLTSHGLEKLEPLFLEHEIDFETLALLTEDDVKELGLPLGPRRKLLSALGSVRVDEAPQPPRDEAERRQLTVMFVDLANSTALATRLDPEAMRDVLRGYQNAVAGEITRVGGHVAKLMGDGVLAYFGWPRAHEDDAERAARAGLAAAEAVGHMTEPGGEQLAARVGIATGLVVVGDLVGQGSAQEHAVVGPTPNLAARLQAEASAGEVVIADETRRLLGAGFVVDAVGERWLKGHAGPLPLFRVVRAAAHERRFVVGAASSSLVGRAAELAALHRAWQQARTGQGQVVLLTGEAGIGKSRLLHSLVETTIGDGSVQEFFQCSTLRGESPFWPIAQRLALAADIIAGDDGPTRDAKLIRALAPRVADPEHAATVLRPLLGLSDGALVNDRPHVDHRGETVAMLTAQILASARTGPALVVFEDLQWADRGTLDILGGLVGSIADVPMLLIATARDERTLELGMLPNLMRLSLGRLDAAKAAALIAETAGKGRLAPRIVETILDRSDGIPLFVEEITKAVIETSSESEAAVPMTLRDSLIARLDVSPAMKSVAQIAACIGREFEESVLRQSTDLAEYLLNEGLDRLTTAGLVAAETAGHYRFRHSLLCDIAYETLLTPRRRALHERIAKTLEAMPDDRALSEPEVLARHWFGAGQHERAEAYWLQARHRAAHWQDQFDALADFLEADGSETAPIGGLDSPRTLH